LGIRRGPRKREARARRQSEGWPGSPRGKQRRKGKLSNWKGEKFLCREGKRIGQGVRGKNQGGSERKKEKRPKKNERGIPQLAVGVFCHAFRKENLFLKKKRTFRNYLEDRENRTRAGRNLRERDSYFENTRGSISFLFFFRTGNTKDLV